MTDRERESPLLRASPPHEASKSPQTEREGRHLLVNTELRSSTTVRALQSPRRSTVGSQDSPRGHPKSPRRKRVRNAEGESQDEEWSGEDERLDNPDDEALALDQIAVISRPKTPVKMSAESRERGSSANQGVPVSPRSRPTRQSITEGSSRSRRPSVTESHHYPVSRQPSQLRVTPPIIDGGDFGALSHGFHGESAPSQLSRSAIVVKPHPVRPKPPLARSVPVMPPLDNVDEVTTTDIGETDFEGRNELDHVPLGMFSSDDDTDIDRRRKKKTRKLRPIVIESPAETRIPLIETAGAEDGVDSGVDSCNDTDHGNDDQTDISTNINLAGALDSFLGDSKASVPVPRLTRYTLDPNLGAAIRAHRYNKRHEPRLDDYQLKRCPFFLFELATSWYLTRSFFSIIVRFSTLFVIIFAVGCEIFCDYFGLHTDLPISLLAVGIVFPVSFGERILLDIASMKASANALFVISREWPPLKEYQRYSFKMSLLVKQLLRRISRYLNHHEERDAHIQMIYHDFDEINHLLEELRLSDEWVKSVISRGYQYVRYMMNDFERLRIVTDFRTPSTFRSYYWFWLLSFPIFFSPFFAHLSFNYGSWAGIYAALLSSLMLVTLSSVMSDMEDPFTGEGYDDLNTEMIREASYLMFPRKKHRRLDKKRAKLAKKIKEQRAKRNAADAQQRSYRESSPEEEEAELGEFESSRILPPHSDAESMWETPAYERDDEETESVSMGLPPVQPSRRTHSLVHTLVPAKIRRRRKKRDGAETGTELDTANERSSSSRSRRSTSSSSVSRSDDELTTPTRASSGVVSGLKSSISDPIRKRSSAAH